MDICVVVGDLLEQRVDCIVNAWNTNRIPWWMLIPSGFESIAFPILGAGSGRFNPEQAETIMRQTFSTLSSEVAVTLVRYKA